MNRRDWLVRVGAVVTGAAVAPMSAGENVVPLRNMPKAPHDVLDCTIFIDGRVIAKQLIGALPGRA